MREGTYVTPSVRLERLLGKGGMGSVWLAHHLTLDTAVAVKLVSKEVAERDPHALVRFKREAALSAKMKSPHAVKTFDHGVMPDGHPYIVMELLEGEDLGSRLARERRLSPRETAVVVAQVAQVLDEAHRLGVVHRDIKPDNVFLVEAGYELFVKVLDFGIAKQTSALDVSPVTDTGAIVGTPEYMSPEQLLSTKSADFRADLWALAVLAYHALVGQVPFQGETLPSLSIEICNGRHTPPSQRIATVGPEVDAWFARAFAVNPADRFDDALDMADSFRHLMRSIGEPSVLDADDHPPDSGRRPTSSAPLDDRHSDADVDHTLRDSGVHPSFAPADADQSGRRAALLVAGGSPTFSGAAANLRPDAAPQRSRLWIAGVIAAAAGLAIAADFALRRSPLPPESGPAPAAQPTAAPASPPEDLAIPSASTAPTAIPATPSATASAPAPPLPHRAPSRAAAERKPPALTDPCANPYVANPDGTLSVKPQCL